MRRTDKQNTDPRLFHYLLETVQVGYLALIQPDGYPRTVPLNFSAMENAIYFHGARAGEKFEALSSSPAVSFCIPEVLSYISSDYLDGDPCEASHFYRSAMIYGPAGICSDEDEKGRALVGLLNKYQPGSQSNNTLGHDHRTRASVEKTAVFKIEIERWEVKENLGGYLSQTARSQLIRSLRSTGNSLDAFTAQLMSESSSASES